MQFSKRGLSEVITTVIIILLVLVAIGIIWAVVNPIIRGTTQQIKSECLTLSLEPVAGSCTIDLPGIGTNAGNGDTTVIIKRNSGAGNLIGVKFLFEDVGGNARPITNTSVGNLTELASKTYVISALEFVNAGGNFVPTKINVAAEVQGRVCDPVSTAVTCTQI